MRCSPILCPLFSIFFLFKVLTVFCFTLTSIMFLLCMLLNLRENAC